jgi:ATP phosphoribosyltransferase
MPTVISSRPTSETVQSASSVAISSSASRNNNGDRLIKMLKSLYQADQQVKFLHLHAETDYLLQQLQTLKQQESPCDRPVSTAGKN